MKSAIFLIVIAGLLIYGNSLNGKFVWDDDHLIKDSPYVKNLANLPKAFVKTAVVSQPGYVAFYRPVQTATYAIDHSLWKLNACGYHLTNVILHILAALALYWLINLLFRDRPVALIASMLFIAHPVHTEAVAYISGRADSLAALFMFLCFSLYIKKTDNNIKLSLPRKRQSIFLWIPAFAGMTLILLCYIFAVLSRENSLILPALLVLYHYTFAKKIRIKEFLPILIIALSYICLRLTYLKPQFPGLSASDNLLNRIPGFFVAITNYIRLIFLPFGLHMEYGYKFFKFTDLSAVLGMLISAVLVIYALRKRNSDKLLFFSVGWFFLTLLVSSNLYPLNAYMAEHWLYVPSAGIFLLVAKILRHFGAQDDRVNCHSEGTKCLKNLIPGIVAAFALIAFYSVLTIRQNTYWRDPITFYERTLKYAPDSPKIYNNLANEYKNAGQNEKAIALCRKAIEIRPDYANAYNTLGFIYYNTGCREEAIASYKKAIEIEPCYAEAVYNLGTAYYDVSGKYEAAELFRRAIRLNPDFAPAYNNLANIYEGIGKNKEAVELYKMAIRLDPGYAAAYNNLGKAFYNAGDMAEAAYAYKKAIDIDPNLAEAYNGMGVICCISGNKEEGMDFFRKALEIRPDFTDARSNLAKARQVRPSP